MSKVTDKGIFDFQKLITLGILLAFKVLHDSNPALGFFCFHYAVLFIVLIRMHMSLNLSHFSFQEEAQSHFTEEVILSSSILSTQQTYEVGQAERKWLMTSQ